MATNSNPTRPEARRASGNVPSIHYTDAVSVARKVLALRAEVADVREPAMRGALEMASDILSDGLRECGYRLMEDHDTGEWFVVDLHDGELFRV